MLSPTFINATPHHLIPQYNGHFLPPHYPPQSHQSGILTAGYHSTTMQSAGQPGLMTMKAIRVHTFGGPEVLNLEDQVVVPQFKDNQVLVRVVYAGVNPVETYIREGLYSRLPDLPYIPGSDAAGYIHEVGSAVKNLKVGDRVFVAGTSSNSGSYAQFVVSDDTYVFPLHDRLTMQQGASLGVPFFTAYKALILRAQTRPGEVVLIHGASGAVGTAAVQIARALGATVVGTAGTKEGMEVVSRCGAHHVFNHNHKAYEKKMLEHLGTGFDVIIEHLANINLGHDLQMLKNGARVMIVGCRGTANINPRHLMLPEACIRGVSLGTSTADEWIEMGAAIVAGIESGWVNPVINQVYNMEDVQKVHHDIIHSKGAKGKLVLRISKILKMEELRLLQTKVSPKKTSVLECRVCEENFGLHGDKIPRLLFCGHSLCHACLSRLPTPQGFMSCPFDRQQTLIGSNGVWELKKNFALIELIERVQTQENVNAFSTAFFDKERELAVPCDEVDEHSAVLYCMVCGTHLCQPCSEQTHSTRTLAKHKRIPLSEKPREKPVCPYHTSHVMEFTCLQTECASSPLMCYICKDYGRHKGHQHNLLELEAENVRAGMTTAVQKMKKFMEEMSDTNRTLEKVLVEIKGNESTNTQNGSSQDGGVNEPGSAELARRRVRAYFQSLRDQLCVQEVAALTVVDTHVRERVCSIRQQEEDIATVLSQVAEVCIQCDRVARQDDARVVLAAQEINQLLESVEVQQQQFSGYAAAGGAAGATEDRDQLPLDMASIPITFTKDNRVHIGPKIEMRVVTLGLDGAGKTAILCKLKQGEFVPTIPTIGFNVETLEFRNVKITLWDVGGQQKLRPLWKHYYLNTQAVIFVLDASSRDRIAESKMELSKLLSEKELKDATLLILANKQDVSGCASIEEIADSFSLYKLCCGRSWHMQACDAKSGAGLQEGLDWLCRQLVAAGIQDMG